MIKVYVENVATGEPYVNQLVYIRENPQNVQEEKKTVYEGVTDSDGRLLINLKCRRNAKYSILIDLPDSYCYIHSLGYPINIDKTNDIHFRLAPCAQLKLKIENVNCMGTDDRFVLYRTNQIGSFDGNFGWEHLGCVYWETNGYSNVPMGEQYYYWEVPRLGSTQTYYDTIYLQEGEQRIYEIKY